MLWHTNLFLRGAWCLLVYKALSAPVNCTTTTTFPIYQQRQVLYQKHHWEAVKWSAKWFKILCLKNLTHTYTRNKSTTVLLKQLHPKSIFLINFGDYTNLFGGFFERTLTDLVSASNFVSQQRASGTPTASESWEILFDKYSVKYQHVSLVLGRFVLQAQWLARKFRRLGHKSGKTCLWDFDRRWQRVMELVLM